VRLPSGMIDLANPRIYCFELDLLQSLSSIYTFLVLSKKERYRYIGLLLAVYKVMAGAQLDSKSECI